MTTKKTAAKRTPAKKSAAKKPKVGDGTKAIIIETKRVPCKSLKPYFKNPRVGDVDTIAKSLYFNGQYRPIVVNIGTLTGRPNEILAGNHTWLGARKELRWSVESGSGSDQEFHKESWSELDVSFVDVNEEVAAAINLVDNKAAEKGGYDEQMLAEVFKLVPNLQATAWETEEVDDILAGLDTDVSARLDDIAKDREEEEEAAEARERKRTFEGADLGDEEEAEDDAPRLSTREREKRREEGQDIDKVSDQLSGALQLSDDINLDFVKTDKGVQIPRLLSGDDHLMTLDDLPDTLRTWAGSATKEVDDPDVWWFYNYGVDSTSGMQQSLSQMIVSFFTWDDYFENWWHYPSRYVTKLLNSKVKYIVTPDFSPNSDMGNCFNLWQLYRSRYLGRYFQEAGLKVLPHVFWEDGDLDQLDDALSTLPDEVPLLCLQAQTIDPKEVVGGIAHYKKQLQIILDSVKPEGLLLYAGKPGLEIVQSLKLGDTEVVHLDHRQGILAEANKGKKKKTTL